MRCSETEWVRARGSCETLGSESPQCCSLQALMCTDVWSAFRLHAHMPTAPLKDISKLCTTVRQSSSPTTCNILSWLLTAQPSQDQLKWHLPSKVFPDEPTQIPMTILINLHSHKTLQAHQYCVCTLDISMWPLSLGLNKNCFRSQFIESTNVIYFLFPQSNVHGECLIYNKVKWRYKIYLTLQPRLYNGMLATSHDK